VRPSSTSIVGVDRRPRRSPTQRPATRRSTVSGVAATCSKRSSWNSGVRGLKTRRFYVASVAVSPTWIWMQAAIVVLVLAGMVIGAIKLW
jgi:hypothetical protein